MDSLFNSALELMFLGMGTVFLFLVALIGATMLMSGLVLRTEKEEEAVLPASFSPSVPQNQNNPAQDARLIQVITEAIKQHRNQ